MTDPLSLRRLPEKFLVAFSYAGEQREVVRPIAEALEQRLGRGTVFYDRWFEAEIAGGPSDLKLQRIYGERAEMVVVCASRDYNAKSFTLAEWDAIRARYMQLRVAGGDETNRVLPLQVGDGEVEGVLGNTIWMEARQKAPRQVAEAILHRLRQFVPVAGVPAVFLAETTPDLEDEDKPVNRQRLKSFLEEELGWVVLPEASLVDSEGEDYRARLETDLRRSLVFVQLVGAYPWKGGGYDRVQHDAAKDLGLPIFRFRGDLDLKKVEEKNPAHFQMLSAADVIAGGFEDFKVHLHEKLKALEQQREVEIRRLQEEEKWAAEPSADHDNPPLVRVSIRSRQPDALWDKVFSRVYENEKILTDQLGASETFKDKQSADPCHGFLILCDEAVLLDESLSPRGDLENCRLVQMQEKDAARRPPVGLVYWPPPEPSWPRLLRATPLKLHRVLGDDALAQLQAFLDEVRKVRKAMP
jgi:hypothetical protein